MYKIMVAASANKSIMTSINIKEDRENHNEIEAGVYKSEASRTKDKYLDNLADTVTSRRTETRAN